MDRARPNRRIQRSQQQSDHSGVDAFQSGLEDRHRAKQVPKRKCTSDQEKRSEENCYESEKRSRPSIRLSSHDRAEVSGESKKRARHGLGSAVARHELFVGHPSGAYNLRLEQRQDNVAPAKNQ